MEKPRVLILGGSGFIGRNLLQFFISNNAASAIRIADKVSPQLAWLNKAHQELFDNSIVEFKSSNLINPESCKAAFTCNNESNWDLVINCAGETKSGQTDPVYKEGILKLSLNCAKEASLHKVKRYVEISSGCLHSDEKIPHAENGPLEPWTFIAKYKLQVESEIAQIPNLPFTIIRLPIVYGIGDKCGLMPRILVSAIYKHLTSKMKILWNGDMKINTVHVEDVCRAIWFVSNRDDAIKQIYNVVDEADSSQSSIFDILSDLFQIEVDYYGNVVSSVIDLQGAVDLANDKHLGPWAEACRLDKVENTPLSPHMDLEMLLHKHLHLDGSKLKNLGFALNVPTPTERKLKEIVDDYVQMGLFPQSLAPS